MERRGFLKSLVGGITSAGLLLKATPAEIQAFGAEVDTPVILSPQQIAAPTLGDGSLMPGAMLYNANGQVVAMVRNLTVQVQPVDVTGYSDEYSIYRSGLPEIRIEAVGLHGEMWVPASVE